MRTILKEGFDDIHIYILHDTDITVYLITCMKIKKIRELNGNRDDDITLC